MLRRHLWTWLLLFLSAPIARAELKILLPQGRNAFQTNEWIDISVIRTAPKAAGEALLSLRLKGTDGSSVDTTFALKDTPLQGKETTVTEHLHVNGWLLRPGKYEIEVSLKEEKATTPIEVFNHVRQSSFKLINWGTAKTKEQQRIQGENSLGFNTFYGHYGQDEEANFIRAGVDFIANCVMSGGHQMDLRLECDWSDPLVCRGGTRRVVKRAMMDRTRPNVPGVHFYDEPGLTWEKHSVTGEFGPHGVTPQVRSYKAAFDRDPPDYHKVDPKNPEQVARWKHWIIWRLGIMDAAWKEAQFGVSQVRPDFLSLTQSQYGWSAPVDGYYFNVQRSLPITSGHGGYHDIGPGVFCPSFFLEMARARDQWKPCWYLPTWYGNTTSDQFRCEQYLSFQTNIQGMISPPDLEPSTKDSARQGIVESNHLMKRLGPIFTTMAPTKPKAAMLYSLSAFLHTHTNSPNRSKNYVHDTQQGKNLSLTYLSGKLIHQPFLVVLDEDVLDGTLANDHKAVVLTSIDYLDPKVVAALESFIQGGGLVLLTGDSTVAIKGATKLSVTPRMPDQEAIDKLMNDKKYDKLGPFTTTAKHIAGALPLAKAIEAELAKAKIRPIVECDNRNIVVTRHSAGDMEYFFLVNATPDPANAKDPRNALKEAVAQIYIPGKGAIYDAVTGEARHTNTKSDDWPVQFQEKLRFGPGQMRVFAHSVKPIGGVKVSTPVVSRDLVVEKEPLTLDIAAALLATDGRTLSGSAPLHIQVIDPVGAIRHELFRATKLGQFSTRLPLAANDPPGRWRVVVRELLNNSEDTATFVFAPPRQARAIAGATQRAVFAADDRDKAFRFGRMFHDVTIVKGKNPWNDAAAKRLSKILAPWGIRCKEMDLAAAAKARSLSEEEARTFVGLQYAGKGQIKAGDVNPPGLVGYAVQGPVILLGSPEDHPIIAHLAKERFLPYAPNSAQFPGPGRGMFAWQRDALGAGQESIALIAYDEAGMSEAVGSFYEAVAGLEPLTRWDLPQSDAITPAKSAPDLYPSLPVAWTVRLPDRVLGFLPEARGLAALSHDGTRTTITAEGKSLDSQAWKAAELEGKIGVGDAAGADTAKKSQRADRLFKFGASGKDKVALAYWGGTLRLVDTAGKTLAEQQLPQDITALTWLGNRLVVGLADGRVQALGGKIMR